MTESVLLGMGQVQEPYQRVNGFQNALRFDLDFGITSELQGADIETVPMQQGLEKAVAVGGTEKEPVEVVDELVVVHQVGHKKCDNYIEKESPGEEVSIGSEIT